MSESYGSKENAENLEWGGVGMTPEAEALYKEYVRRLQRRNEEVNRTPLVVLVWGPGSSGGDLFEKRQQIRTRLRQRGDAALFSEELDKECHSFAASARARELMQAEEADFIVVIYSSHGSIAETHDFGSFMSDLGSKMLIFIDSQHVGGYGYTGLLSELKGRFNNVETFEYPKDILECHLLSLVEDKLRDLRFAKWLENRPRRSTR